MLESNETPVVAEEGLTIVQQWFDIGLWLLVISAVLTILCVILPTPKEAAKVSDKCLHKRCLQTINDIHTYVHEQTAQNVTLFLLRSYRRALVHE